MRHDDAASDHTISWYSALARMALEGRPIADCAPDTFADGMFGAAAYTRNAGLPEAAMRTSLGCENPVAVARLEPGEIVLDLGSGGGLDVLLSARRAGPTGTQARGCNRPSSKRPSPRTGRRAHLSDLSCRGSDQRSEADQRLSPGAVVDPHAPLVPLEQPGLVQDLEVMADRWLGQIERTGQITDARFAARVRGHQRHQAQPHGIGKRFQQRSHSPGLLGRQRLLSQRRAARRHVRRVQQGQ